MRARKRKVAQPVAAAVEPTITRSRAVTTLATSHVPPTAARGRKRNAGRPQASGDPLMTSQAVDDRRPVADRDLPQMAAYTSASWHVSDDSRSTSHPHTGHQAAAPLLESAAATTARRDWEETVEQRLLQSHQLLQEMHQMMSEQRDHGDAQLGAQSSADFVTPLTDLPQGAILLCAPGRTVSGQVDGATAPPWPVMQGPSSHGEQGLGVGAVIDSLPQQTRERVCVFTKTAVFIHAHEPANLRGKVWSGECVEMSSLLHGFRSSEHNLTLGLYQQGDNGPSVVCVGPKAKPEIKEILQWVKGFHIYICLCIYHSQSTTTRALHC